MDVSIRILFDFPEVLIDTLLSLFLDDCTLKLYYPADLLPFLKELTVQIFQAFVYFIICLKMMNERKFNVFKVTR